MEYVGPVQVVSLRFLRNMPKEKKKGRAKVWMLSSPGTTSYMKGRFSEIIFFFEKPSYQPDLPEPIVLYEVF